MKAAARKALSLRMKAIHAQKKAAAKVESSEIADEMINLEIPKSLAAPMLQMLLRMIGQRK